MRGFLVMMLVGFIPTLFAFTNPNTLNKPIKSCTSTSTSTSTSIFVTQQNNERRRGRIRRRDVIKTLIGASIVINTNMKTNTNTNANAAFTPGGTLVDRDVGVQIGNPEASSSRMEDNSNVLFKLDHYFKFGTAAPFIEPDSVEFPKSMPFVLSQQRYDALKKYGDRVKSSLNVLDELNGMIESGKYDSIDPSSDAKYGLRPMGLLCNNFMASENTGTTNELFLARWYINEIGLDVDDIKSAKSKDDAMKSYIAAKKSANSLLAMLNRVITSKVGSKFDYLTI